MVVITAHGNDSCIEALRNDDFFSVEINGMARRNVYVCEAGTSVGCNVPPLVCAFDVFSVAAFFALQPSQLLER